MNRRRMSLLVALVALSLTCTARADDRALLKRVSPANDALRAELQQRLDGDSAAWNRGDLEAFCASYAEDATFVSPSGITHGRAEVLARYRKRYPDRHAMGTLKLEIREVRPVQSAPGAAPLAVSVVAHWSLRYPDKPESAGSTLLVFHRDAHGGWKIVQDASM